MIDDVDAVDGRGERRRIAQVAGRELDARGIDGRGRVDRWTSAHLVAARAASARQMAAGKPRRAGYEDAHRSATSVTGRSEQAQQPGASSTAFDDRREPARSDRLVQGDRQDELAMHRADAEAVPVEGLRDRAVGEDAIRLGLRPGGMRDAPRERLEQRDAVRRRIVDDDEALGHAAQLSDALPPLRRVHEHAQADGDVEAAIGKIERVGIADTDERTAGSSAARRARRPASPPTRRRR